MDRRRFLQTASIAGMSLAAGSLSDVTPVQAANDDSGKKGFDYKIAFGAWINDMRSDPVPLTDWPAHQFDDCTVDSTIAVLDLMAECGCKYLDAFGLWATRAYPLDVVSAFQDSARKTLLDKLFKAADQRGVRLFLPLGLMTWGYDEIIAKDAAVRRQDGVANPCPSAMCGAQEKSWSYIEKIIEAKYRPRTPEAGQKLRELLSAVEEGFYAQWENADERFFDVWKIPPRCEWKLNDALFGKSPDPAMYLLEPYLTPEGRQNYKAALVKSLAILDDIRHSFDDNGRIERMRRCLIVTCHMLNTVIAAKGEPGWN